MELVTREEEIQRLIEEQAEDDAEQIVYPEYKGRHRNMSLDVTGDEGGSVDIAGVYYDFEEMIEQGDPGLEGEVVTPHLLNPKGRHGQKYGGVLVEIPHGTYNGYHNYQCRCDACRATSTPTQRMYREKRLAQPVPERVHGTYNGYKNYACRCDECVEAHKLYQREYRRRRPRKPLTPEARARRNQLARKRREANLKKVRADEAKRKRLQRAARKAAGGSS